MKTTSGRFLVALLVAGMIALGCTAEGTDVSFPDQDIRMTFMHTTDTHSKVLPFKYIPSWTDESLGILPCPGDAQLDGCHACLGWELQDLAGTDLIPDVRQCSDCSLFNKEEEVCPDCDSASYDNEACYACIGDVRSSKRCDYYTFGGAARIAWAINRERKSALRFAHVNTGDSFQGAPIFNLFAGAAEIRALSVMGVDASVIGNHEFDKGAANFAELIYDFAAFPVLNANYMFESSDTSGSNGLGDIVDPFFIKDYDGLKIGYIGLGNLRSINSLGDADNSMGLRAIDTNQALRTYVPLIRDQVDLLVVLSHLGVEGDIRAARQVPGIDIFFGGHDHVVLNPPLEIINPEGKTTLVVHSGVNFKCITRLDIVVRNRKILAHDFKVIPITSPPKEGGEGLGEDPLVANMLYDYQWELDRAQDLEREIGVALSDFPRYAPGDSPLGNLVADAMRSRERVETDFAITNSLGIRADLDKGTVKVGKMYEIFPFENSIVTMYMSGPELQSLFNYIASRTAAYGGKTQIQLSGARTELDINKGLVKYLEINGIVVVEDYDLKEPYVVFNMATNDYIADGGSGFDILEQNTTKSNTMLSLRDVVIDYVENAQCIYASTDKNDCKEQNGHKCICPQTGRITMIK